QRENPAPHDEHRAAKRQLQPPAFPDIPDDGGELGGAGRLNRVVINHVGLLDKLSLAPETGAGGRNSTPKSGFCLSLCQTAGYCATVGLMTVPSIGPFMRFEIAVSTPRRTMPVSSRYHQKF